MSSLPDAFTGRLREIIGPDDFENVVATFSAEKRTAFRVNTLLAETAVAVSDLASQGFDLELAAWYPDAFSIDHRDRDRLLESAAAGSGAIYIQNFSSMIPVLELGPRPGEKILDLTAAPGSKTSQIAAIMDNDGYLAAVESVRSRYYKLKDNLERLGVTNVRPILKDGTGVWRYRTEYFDRVLLDAPCSSEGRFRTDDPKTTHYWSLRKIREMQRKQRRLFKSAIQSVRVGGTIVYSTCSFAPEENEAVVAKTLHRFGDVIQEVPLEVPCPNYVTPLHEWQGKSFGISCARRILPDEYFDAFFVARFVKTASCFPRDGQVSR